MKALVIAGTASGVGKTTVASGLMAALRRRGFVVQPFKVGPDYIDPSYHLVAAGRPSRNLDAWMLTPNAMVELYWRAASTCDVAIIEGVMGLYDGKSGTTGLASTAHVAKLIGAPVVLVLDAARTARSAAATALGFRDFDPELDIAGVVLNNVASPSHLAALAEPIEREAGLPVLGQLARDSTWRREERYLGLVPTPERPLDPDVVEALANAIDRGVDVPRLLGISERARAASPPSSGLFPDEPRPVRARVAVAQDEAFNFYYQDNLDLLAASGAELVPFSPRRAERLPHDASAVYLGGGFPELYAEDLAENVGLLNDLRRAAADGLPIYAECGGLMYLSDGLIDRDGNRHAMAGVLPGWSTLAGGRLTLGYREVLARQDSIILRHGDRIRGHEFHWSIADPPPDDQAAYDVLGDTPRREGHVHANVLASYVHLHFASDTRLATRLVDAAEAWSGRRPTERPPSRLTSGEATSGERAFPAPCHPASGRHPERSEGSHAHDQHGAREHEILRSAQDDNRADSDVAGKTAWPSRTGPADGTDSVAPTNSAGGIGSPSADELSQPISVGPLLRHFGLPPADIEQRSMRRIADELGPRLPPAEPERSLAARLVYAAGDAGLVEHVSASVGAIDAAVSALASGADTVVDVGMVAAGLNRPPVERHGGTLLVAIETPGARGLAEQLGITRTAAGMLTLGHRLDGAVIAIGNAPTALLAVLDLINTSGVTPAAILGFPVGFVAAAESKEALLACSIPWITIRGTRGGSPLAAAALNHLFKLAAGEPHPQGRDGTGVGPAKSTPGRL